MKILDFEVSLNEIENGKLELSDMVKSSIFQHEPQWFDRLDFEDDNIFLEPSLFLYFRKLSLQRNPTKKLDQILFGYTTPQNEESILSCKTDIDGVIHLPNLGNIDTGRAGVEEYDVRMSSDRKNVYIGNDNLKIQPLIKILDNQFGLLMHKSEMYDEIEDRRGLILYMEKIGDSVNSSRTKLTNTLIKLKDNIPHFFESICMVTREFGIFNSNSVESFAAIHYFGTAFLNLAGQKQNEVFFIDDVAHQAGHIVYYALTHEYKRFLKPNINTLLKDYTDVSYEQRNVYGAFHGLFTYTTILHCLHIALSEKWFKYQEEEEALARLGFYYEKFEKDLKSLGDNRILTENGWKYYDMFQSGFTKIKKEYYHIIKYFDYTNQNYNFNFKKFQEINQLKTV